MFDQSGGVLPYYAYTKVTSVALLQSLFIDLSASAAARRLMLVELLFGCRVSIIIK